MTDPANHRRIYASSWRYGRFDGSGEPLKFDGDDVLAGLGDDLLYHGDLAAALRQLLKDGFDSAAGERVAGIDEIMRKIAERKRTLGEQGSDLGARIAHAVDEVLDLERSELSQRNDEASMMASLSLELLPEDLLGRIEALREHSFASAAAERRFSELMDQLRHDLVQQQLDNAASQLATATPEEQAHLRDGLDALNRLIEQRAQGEDVSEGFAEFKEQFGDLFPGDPETLDELMAQLAQRMSAASSMMASMTPEQRAQFGALSDQLLSDVDLAWQMSRLGENLRDAMPDLPWESSLGSTSGDPFSILGDAQGLAELASLSELERMLSSAAGPDQLRELDLDRVQELLGPEASRSLEALARLTAQLEEAGLVGRREGRLELTPQGVRHLGSQALSALFARLRRDRVGNHAVSSTGDGHDLADETRAFQFGDPFRINLQQTLRNATVRQAQDGSVSGTVPISLTLDDFELDQTEHLSNAATVLAIDLSLSMPMEDNFLAAKKVAIALQSLIASRYPRDHLGLIGFSATAREIGLNDLPQVSWDFAYGTNLQHALQLGRKMLSTHSGTKQIIVITDGEPTAHIEDDGGVFFNYPAVPETIERTMREVLRCTKEHIVINTFVLNSTGALRSFVDRMTQMNRGRAFYATPDTLGDYVLVDFVANHSAKGVRKLRGRS